MTTLSVKCPECTLSVVDISHPDVSYARDSDGNVLCPNCKVPMRPIGEGQTRAAEQAFTEAARELAPDQAPATTMPPADTVETLTKRLREIEKSRNTLLALERELEAAREEAKDAKKNYDNGVESHLALVGRMVAVSTPLPLFTAEAEQAAQTELPHATNEALLAKLADAGVTLTDAQIAGWTPDQRAGAWHWAAIEGSVEAMPDFVAEAATEPDDDPTGETEDAAATTTA